MANWRTDLATSQIPERMLGTIERWIEHGIPPGHFLSAVISNDLRETFARADDENVNLIREYIRYFYISAPCGCWGSAKALDEWKGLGRRAR